VHQLLQMCNTSSIPKNQAEKQMLEKINTHFSAINKTYVSKNNMVTNLEPDDTHHTLSEFEVYKLLSKIDVKKGNVPGCIPSSLLNFVANEISPVITSIFNLSFEKCIVPHKWKIGYITPLAKSPKVTSFDDLRPISNTDTLGKVLEGVMQKRLYKNVSSKINLAQYGSIKKSSTTHCLVKMMDFLLSSLERPKVKLVISMNDLRKAFDLVDHDILINLLKQHKIPNYDIRWIANFLSDRSQTVVYKNNISESQRITCGVPQGTKLAPTLFVILMNSVLDHMDSTLSLSNSAIQGVFVDDHTLCEKVGKNNKSSSECLLNMFNNEVKNIKMCMNPKKCITINVDFSKEKSTVPNIQVGSDHIPQQMKAKLLGVIINNRLKWDDHVTSIKSKVSKRISYLKKLRALGFKSCELLHSYKVFIRPVIEYAAPVWYPAITISQKRSIENIQRRIISFITKKHQMKENYSKTLNTLKLKSIADRMEDLIFKFGNSLLFSDRFRSLLPPVLSKGTGRVTRSRKGLLVEKTCKRMRYYNSTIPTITRLINNKYKTDKKYREHINSILEAKKILSSIKCSTN